MMPRTVHTAVVPDRYGQAQNWVTIIATPDEILLKTLFMIGPPLVDVV